MKNLILVVAAIAICAGAYAQTESTKRKTNQGDMNNNPNQNMQNKPVDKSYPEGLNDSKNKKTNQGDMKNNKNQIQQNHLIDQTHPDGVMMHNGKIMKVKNGEMTILKDKSMTLSNGTKIMSDGTYIKKDGKKMTLKEGQHMDMSGNIKPMKTIKDKKMYLVPDSTIKKTNKL